jgi:hypothetical protein
VTRACLPATNAAAPAGKLAKRAREKGNVIIAGTTATIAAAKRAGLANLATVMDPGLAKIAALIR